MKVIGLKIKFSIFLMVCCVLSLGNTAYADIWGGTKNWGGVTVVNNDASVTTFGYTSIYEDAKSNWTGLSSQVSFTTGAHSNADKYFVGNTSDPNLFGRIIPYRTSSGTIAGAEDNWHHVNVSIYDNTMRFFGMNRAQRVGNATHEIGHSLKLAHPTISVSSIMNQGIQSISPTTYDQSELRRKWGN